MIPILMLLSTLVQDPADVGPRPFVALEQDGKPPLYYTLAKPDGFDPARAYPTVLAFPPGAQTAEFADKALTLYFDAEAKRRGFVVVCPVVQDQRLFFDGAEETIPALLDLVAREVNVEGGRFLLAGPSNGGLAAFHAATLWPERFACVIAFPGFARPNEDLAKLAPIVRLPVSIFVGGNDNPLWLEQVERTKAQLIELGTVSLTVTVLPGEGHRPQTFDGGVRLFDELDKARAAAVLDALHDAAAKADGARYFDLFTSDAVFIGTDATERWTLEQFKAYATPFFAQGKGWTYVPKDRHVEVHGDIAWFDERLENAKYGSTRGSGVLRLVDGHWRIAQYVLSMAVPNDKAAAVVEVIKSP